MITDYNLLIGIMSGGIFVAAMTVAWFFYRASLTQRDPFFRNFAIAFALIAVERIALIYAHDAHEARPSAYLLRFAAFLVIIIAVVRKNVGVRR